jgi:transcriptional regulator with XRE-family HTH domain
VASSPFYAELGRRTKQRREELHLSQDEVGRALGLTRTSIANLERGEQRITAEAFVTLAAILRIDLGALAPTASPSAAAVRLVEEKAPDAIKGVLRAALARPV